MSTVSTIRFDIFIAGDLAQAKQACREFCFEQGLCVTVEPVAYIYTGGEEIGVRIFLDEIPADLDWRRKDRSKNIECGVGCAPRTDKVTT